MSTPESKDAQTGTGRANTRGAIIVEFDDNVPVFDPSQYTPPVTEPDVESAAQPVLAAPPGEVQTPTPAPQLERTPQPGAEPALVPVDSLAADQTDTAAPVSTETVIGAGGVSLESDTSMDADQESTESSQYGAYADEDGNIDYSQLESMEAVQDMALGLGSDTFDEAGIEQGQNVVRDMDFRQLTGELPQEAQEAIVDARPMRVLEVRDFLAAQAGGGGVPVPFDYGTPSDFETYDPTTGELINEELTQAMVNELIESGGWRGDRAQTGFWVSSQEAVDDFDRAREALSGFQGLRDINRLLSETNPLDSEAEIRGWRTDDNAPTTDGFMWGSRGFNDPAPGDVEANPVSAATAAGGGGWRAANGMYVVRQTQDPGTMTIPTIRGETIQRTSPGLGRSPNPIIYDQDQRELLENEEMMLWEAQHGYYQNSTSLTRDERAALSREIASGSPIVDSLVEYERLNVTQRSNLMFHQGVFLGRRLAPLGNARDGTDQNAGYWTIPARRAALETLRAKETATAQHLRGNLHRSVRRMYQAAAVLHQFPYERINAMLPANLQSPDLSIDTPEGGRVGTYGQMRQGVPEDAQQEYDRMIYGQLTAEDLDDLTAGLSEHRQRYATRRQPPDWMMIIEDAPGRARGGATYERLRETIESQLVLRGGTTGGDMQPLHTAFYTERDQAAARAETRRLNSQRAALNQATLVAYRSGDSEASAMGDALAVLDQRIARQQIETNPQQVLLSTTATVQNARDGSAGAVILAMAGEAPDPTSDQPGATLPGPRFVYPARITRESDPARRAQLEIEYLSGLLATNLTRTMSVQLQIRQNLAVVKDTTDKIEATDTGLARGLALPPGSGADTGALGITQETSPSLLRVITENGGLSHNDPNDDPIVEARARLQREFNLIRDRNPQVDADDYGSMVDYFLACIRENESVYLDPTIPYKILEETPRDAGARDTLTDRSAVRISDTSPYRYVPVVQRADESQSEYRGRVFRARNRGEVFVAAYHFDRWGGSHGGAFNDLDSTDQAILMEAARRYDEAIARRQPYWAAANADTRAQSEISTRPRQALYGTRRGRIQGGDLTRYDASSLYGQLAVLNFAYARLLTGTGDSPEAD